MAEKIRQTLKSAGRFFVVHPATECVTIAFVLNLILESLSRHSVFSALWFLFSSFPFFLVGTLIVALTVSIALFFKRRYFVYTLVTAVWLALGITQAVLMGIRAEPFAAVDFVILLSAFRLIPQYIGVVGIILVVLAFSAAGVLATVIFKSSPVRRADRKKSIALTLTLAAIFAVLHAVTVVFGWIDIEYKDAHEAYGKYGFAYCFTRSFVDFGVDEPEEYSREAVERLIAKLSDEPDASPSVNGEAPNVVFLQLESFFDPKYIKDLDLPADPTPNFTSMKREGPSGLLHVNTIGGGTANTEFQVLCGMNLSHFGIVEYPYSTVLDEKTAPSLATVFSDLGYRCTALHNHTATFYSRHKVYANLGFDSFVPVEYMKDVEYNPIGWEKDAVLADEIASALDSTEGEDFIFAVSVEGHGNYPDHDIFGDEFPVTGERYADIKYQLEYYINTVHNIDRFLGELCDELSRRGEPVILVVYGDHMPSLGLTEDDVTLPDLYRTEYAVWSNFDLAGGASQDEDIESYELSSKILSVLGLRGNAINRLHNERGSLPSFQMELELLEYDILYGDSYSCEDFATDMSFGTREIAVTDVVPMPVSGRLVTGGALLVRGENFTPFSCVFVDGAKKETEFVGENALICFGVTPEPGQKITVVQISDGVTRLGETDIFVLGG